MISDLLRTVPFQLASEVGDFSLKLLVGLELAHLLVAAVVVGAGRARLGELPVYLTRPLLLVSGRLLFLRRLSPRGRSGNFLRFRRSNGRGSTFFL